MELENTVNSRLGNLMADFRKDLPSMQEKDVKLFLFITLDFSGKSISVFLDIPIDRVYNRKNALKKRLKQPAMRLPKNIFNIYNPISHIIKY